jgi:hypothetical protein
MPGTRRGRSGGGRGILFNASPTIKFCEFEYFNFSIIAYLASALKITLGIEMLNISPTVFGRLVEDADRAFILKLIGFLRENVPELGSEPLNEMVNQIDQLMNQARIYGLTSEKHIASFTLTAAQLGLDFVGKFPGAHEILNLPVPPDDKVELLEAFTLNLLEILELNK